MGLRRSLQHWFTGRGPSLQPAAFVPESHPMRLWAETFPWEAMVPAVEHSVAQRFPTQRPIGGRPPVSPRVLWALERLKHAVGESDEAVGHRLRTDVAMMEACGLHEVAADRAPVHCVLPETLAQFRRRLAQERMEALGASQAAAAMEGRTRQPSPSVGRSLSLRTRQAACHRCHDRVPGPKKSRQRLERITRQSPLPTTPWSHPAHERPQTLHKVLRSFGRQCRGQGKVFVTLVRQTARHLLARGEALATWPQETPTLVPHTTALREPQRQRLRRDLEAARAAPRQIVQQSPRLTHGKGLQPCKMVKASDPTRAPIRKGKSHGPAQCGRKTGMLSAPASGFSFAHRVPEGNPRDPSDVWPLLDKGPRASDLVPSPHRVRVPSLGGALGINDAALRHALHGRGMLTVGMPTTGAPLNPTPRQQEVQDILKASGFPRLRTPPHVHLACARGSSRPVVESHIATVRSRGAGHVRYKGLEGAIIPMGMTVMAHHGAVLVRIRQQHLSKRGQKFRRLLGLRRRNVNDINGSKT